MDYKFINTEYLDSVSGGDRDIIRELVKMFIEQSEEIYTEMRTHLENKNYLQLGQLAHKAKSSVAIMGMSDLASLLKSFELHAKDSIKTELYYSYIERFKKETDLAIIELNDLISK